MAITKDKKQEIYKKAQGVIKDAASVVFVNFHGLSMEDTTKLRKGLKKEGVSYMVAKKSLAKRALNDAKIEGEMPELEGELALVHSKDLLAPARGIFEFQKAFKDKVSIVGGVFEGKYMNKEAMMVIATIPPLIVLRGQFVNLINSPIQQFVVALDQIAANKKA
jgi:large subunit ribosomal protein L10